MERRAGSVDPGGEIIAVSPAMRRAVSLVDRFGPTRLPILLVGPTGTGKEVLARRIHRVSGRAGEFVDVNCGALPRDMVESLLFGHRRGAFTGAYESHIGLVEQSNGGTVFLDELLSLPVTGQAKLLRVLETGEIRPLGERTKRRVEFRAVAALQDDPRRRVEAGELRADLFQRLAGVVIALPPLGVRPEDIIPLAAHFAAAEGRRLEPGAKRVLLNYDWPGNVRELRTAVERAGCLVENGTLPPGALAEAIHLGATVVSGAPRVSAHRDRRTELFRVCEFHDWDISRIMEALGVSRATAFRRLKAAGLSLRLHRKSH